MEVPRAGFGAMALRRAGRVEDERAGEVVPAATRAHLHDVAGVLALASRELLELLGRGDAAPVLREPGPEDVGDEHQLLVLTDRTVTVGRLRGLPSRPHQLGVGVAHLVLGEAAFPELRDQVLARESVVDLAGCAGGGAPHGSGTEAHGRRG